MQQPSQESSYDLCPRPTIAAVVEEIRDEEVGLLRVVEEGSDVVLRRLNAAAVSAEWQPVPARSKRLAGHLFLHYRERNFKEGYLPDLEPLYCLSGHLAGRHPHEAHPRPCCLQAVDPSSESIDALQKVVDALRKVVDLLTDGA